MATENLEYEASIESYMGDKVVVSFDMFGVGILRIQLNSGTGSAISLTIDEFFEVVTMAQRYRQMVGIANG